MLATTSASRLQNQTMSKSVCTFEDLDEEELKRLRHRGRANRCNTCLADENKVVILEKGRMEAHIYKEHVAPARVPFRCTVCQFRCQDKRTLQDHVTNYKPHVKAVKVAKSQVPEDCLKESSNPYIVSEEDYHVFSQEESTRIWFELRQKRTGPRESLSFLDGAVADAISNPEPLELEPVIPPCMQTKPDVAPDLTMNPQPQPAAQIDLTLQLLSSMLNSGLLQLGPGFNVSCLPACVPTIQGGETTTSLQTASLTAETAANSSLGDQDGAIVLPTGSIIQTPVQDEYEVPPGWSPSTALQASLLVKSVEMSSDRVTPTDITKSGTQPNEKESDNCPVPPPAHGGHSIPPVSDKDEAMDLTVATAITEDLRSQLSDDTEEPSLDDDIRRVRASSVQPDALNIAVSPTSTYSTSTGSSTMSASILMEIKNMIQEGSRAMQKEIDGNPRTVRNLEKAINEQT